MTRYKVVTLIGTRPEILKLSRVMALFDQVFEHIIVHTGQNYDYELNTIFFDQLGLRMPDHVLYAASPGALGQHFVGAAPDMSLRAPHPTACQTIARVIERAEAFLMTAKPDAVMIYGDTNSCLSALAAKRLKIPIFHMEAGNRCFDQRVPEEINRRLIDHLSDVNLALTHHARRYLLAEGLPSDRTFVVGSHMPEVLAHYGDAIAQSRVLGQMDLSPKGYLLASLHREETVDAPAVLEGALQALATAGQSFGVPVLVSTHPRTRARLGDYALHEVWPGLRFCKPFGFFDYVQLQLNALCTISDSGTLAEEAAILGFPAVWARQSHERPEAVEAGAVVLWNPLVPSALHGAIALAADNPGPKAVADYQDLHVAQKIASIVQGYIPQVRQHTWGLSPEKGPGDSSMLSSGRIPSPSWGPRGTWVNTQASHTGQLPVCGAQNVPEVQSDSAMGQLA